MTEIASYHAHIYYSPATRPIAEGLREQIAARFSVQLGRWHDRPVGPHATSMYQVAFAAELFPTLVPWLMMHRQGLTVLVHPNSGEPYNDHLHNALWLGAVLPITADQLPRAEAPSAIVPNTQGAAERL